jgi:diaminopimelate decarboxylase
MLNSHIRYLHGKLFCDEVPVEDIAAEVGTPVYIYSLPRVLENLRRIQSLFPEAHIHFSSKSNANLAVLGALIGAGAGVDAVSAGEIHRALLVGARPEDIVFAGVGKTHDELEYAIRQGVGWINVENVRELDIINGLASVSRQRTQRVALRLNPDVTASTHPYIATGHSYAKFGLTAEVVRGILADQSRYPQVRIEGLHIHIGSQLHDTAATQRALEIALELIAPYPQITIVNIGGGLPVPYAPDDVIPAWEDFAAALRPMLTGYTVILEPGRSIVADAGLLVCEALYVKQQAGTTILIVDASMAELIRPALYEAHHEIVPLTESAGERSLTQVVGPVCESADVLGRDVSLPNIQPGERLAILNAGAYGMVMASNYNQRPRPPEVVVRDDDPRTWMVARRRETWDDLTRLEMARG